MRFFARLFEQTVARSPRVAVLEVEPRVGEGKQRVDLGVESQSQCQCVLGIEYDRTASLPCVFRLNPEGYTAFDTEKQRIRGEGAGAA
jgi:hypothetical protein